MHGEVNATRTYLYRQWADFSLGTTAVMYLFVNLTPYYFQEKYMMYLVERLILGSFVMLMLVMQLNNPLF